MTALILDLDRTLVDLQSYTDYDAAWAGVAELIDPASTGSGPDTGWSSSTRACMGVIATVDDPELWRRLSSIIEGHERAALVRSRAMPHVVEFLAATADRPRAVVTLLPATVAADVLAAHGLDIEVVVGRDPHIRPKPSGAGLQEALRLLGQSGGAATMVGDSTWDALAAADAGVGFVGVHAPPAEFAALDPPVPACATLLEVLAVLDHREDE
jgi:phosphoglycolate phosphatase-like HAD superfamily hydrolase